MMGSRRRQHHAAGLLRVVRSTGMSQKPANGRSFSSCLILWRAGSRAHSDRFTKWAFRIVGIVLGMIFVLSLPPCDSLAQEQKALTPLLAVSYTHLTLPT